MANRKRKIVLRVPVTAEEQALIQQKMALLHTANFSAYARKMLIDGYIVNVARSGLPGAKRWAKPTPRKQSPSASRAGLSLPGSRKPARVSPCVSTSRTASMPSNRRAMRGGRRYTTCSRRQRL